MTKKAHKTTEAVRARYNRWVSKPGNREKVRQYSMTYRSRPEIKEKYREYHKAYNASPEARKRRKAARSTDEQRMARREYLRKRRSDPIIAEQRREYERQRNATPEGKRRIHSSHLKKKYGLTADDVAQMLEAQGGKCAICMSTDPVTKHWHVDHCHTTGVVRGILCAKCNTGLGRFDDDPDRLLAAAEYIRRQRGDQSRIGRGD